MDWQFTLLLPSLLLVSALILPILGTRARRHRQARDAVPKGTRDGGIAPDEAAAAGRSGVEAVRAAAPPEPVEAPPVAPRPPVPAPAGDRSAEATVLVVDDDETIRDALARILAAEGMRVVAGGTGEDLLRLAREHAPDLVTLDAMLPDMSGPEALARLRKEPYGRKMRVLMLTGVERDRLELADAEYLCKPVDRKRLVATVRRVLAGGGAAEAETSCARARSGEMAAAGR